MIFFKKVLIFMSIFPLAWSQETIEHNLLPRPLIIEMNEAQCVEEVQVQCTSWRVAVEANNLRPWRTIPEECGGYVKDYMTGRGYEVDLQRVSNEAGLYARNVNLSEVGKMAWIFDVDETLLSNIPYYAQRGYGLEIFNSTIFDEWVEMGMAPAIMASLKLYEEVLRLGFKVILLTGRRESHRNITVENLLRAGFSGWDKLVLRSPKDHEKTATKYKSGKRDELVEEGYHIIGNFGDQWSDLLGSSVSNRSFKLPNPMYYIP